MGLFAKKMPKNNLHLALNFMKSYLEDRKQFVQFDKCISEMKAIHKEVPQGSILGPLFFLIYINNIPNSSNLFNFLMYADDTTLYCCLEDIDSVNKELVLNSELKGVHLWLSANKLTLNVNKSNICCLVSIKIPNCQS